MALLFYDRNAGQGEFYDTDGQGNIALMKSYSGWRTTWTQILPCTVAQSGSPNLFFYDSNAGAAEFYSTDFLANISQLSSSTYSNGWTFVVPSYLAARNINRALLIYISCRGLLQY